MSLSQISDPSLDPPCGVVAGWPHALLRLEGGALLGAATLAYAHLDGGWVLFAALFLAPDVFMAGYLAGRRIGAAVYNFGHTTLTPAALCLAALALDLRLALLVGLIWIAHIGFDRAAGYGLKYAAGFGSTHLGGEAVKTRA